MEQYDQKVVDCIKYLVDCDELSREEKMHFIKKARKALGQTALLLSGGGSISMYHAGKHERENGVRGSYACVIARYLSAGMVEPFNGNLHYGAGDPGFAVGQGLLQYERQHITTRCLVL